MAHILGLADASRLREMERGKRDFPKTILTHLKTLEGLANMSEFSYVYSEKEPKKLWLFYRGYPAFKARKSNLLKQYQYQIEGLENLIKEPLEIYFIQDPNLTPHKQVTEILDKLGPILP